MTKDAELEQLASLWSDHLRVAYIQQNPVIYINTENANNVISIVN